MPITGTVPLGGPIAPTSETDKYPVMDPIYGKGSFRTVQTITDRNNITQLRREKGMLVYVIEDGGGSGQYYSLIGGTSNDDWTVFSPLGARGADGVTGPTGPQIVIIDSFQTTVPSTLVKGSSTYSLTGKTLSLSYAGGVIPATGSVYLTDSGKGTGFPVYFPTPSLNSLTFSGQTLTAGVGESITLRVSITGFEGSNDYYDFSISFQNEFLYGGSTHENLTSTMISSLGNSITGDDLNQNFRVDLNYMEYIYCAHPVRKGQSIQSINNAVYGGMSLQGTEFIPGTTSVTYQNSNGFVEDFYVYRSNRANLGSNLLIETKAAR